MEQTDASFDSIIGHDRPIRILRRAIAGGTLAHAYLFSGENGIGKKKAAVALAAAVNCPNAGAGGACGSCPSCRRVSSRSHPDVHYLVPDGDEIKIDQVRDAQAALALRPFEGLKKVLIVDGADGMNDASSNAVLKTLEEPPGESVIILISARPQRLLPTIRSRCQEVRFFPLPRTALAEALRQRRGLDAGESWFLAALAQGSIGRGLEMDPGRERTDRDELRGTLARLPVMGDDEVLALAEAAVKDRDQFERVLDLGIERLRDMAVLRVTGDEQLMVYSQPGARAGEGEEQGLAGMLADLDLFIASKDMLSRRVSGQLVAENLFFKLRGR